MHNDANVSIGYLYPNFVFGTADDCRGLLDLVNLAIIKVEQMKVLNTYPREVERRFDVFML